MSRYIDEDGNPITIQQWMDLIQGGGVGYALVTALVPLASGKDAEVTTRWFGTVFPEVDAKPFGTGISTDGGISWGELEQYDTKAEALEGHERWVRHVTASAQNDEPKSA